MVTDRLNHDVAQSLFFPDMFSRQEQIDSNFDGVLDSYGWVFNAPAEQPAGSETSTCRMDDFSAWLKSGDGIFWINGKPGSGKSTLMSYISNQERRLDLLRYVGSQSRSLCFAKQNYPLASLNRPECTEAGAENRLFKLVSPMLMPHDSDNGLIRRMF